MARLAQKAGIPDGVINVVPGLRSDRRVGDRQASGRRQGRLHGRVGDRPDHPAGGGRHDEAAHLRAGRQEPQRGLRRRRSGRGRDGAHFALYFNQGQCCCAGSRLFVERRVYDEFVDRLVEKNKSGRLGDPFDPSTEQGPQVDQAQFDKILKYVDIGKQDGAECVTGGKRLGDRATSSSRRCSERDRRHAIARTRFSARS